MHTESGRPWSHDQAIKNQLQTAPKWRQLRFDAEFPPLAKVHGSRFTGADFEAGRR